MLDMSCFSNRARQRQIRLLVCLHKSLQRIDIFLLRHFPDLVEGTRHLMMRAPNSCTRRPGLVSQPHAVHGIASRTLHRSNVKSESVLSLERAPNVEVRIATTVMARDTGTLVRLANLADLTIPVRGNEPKSFGRLEFFGLSKLDLRRPYRAHHMHPVITHRSFQGLTRTDGFAHCLLPLTIQLDGFLHHFLLESLLFAIPVRLLLMRYLGWFHQLVLRPRHWAENAFVARRDHRTAVVRAHITQPFHPVA